MSSDIKRVLLIGPTGTLGKAILDALIEDDSFAITTLRRSSSKDRPLLASRSNGEKVDLNEIFIDDAFRLEELERAFQCQDAVIAAFRLTDVSQHLRVAEAAYRSDVKRYIPADFGSCDAASPWAQEMLQLYRDKTLVRDKCEKIAADQRSQGFSGYKNFTWTALICGHFFDFALHHFDFDKKTVKVLDGGDIPASSSTFKQVGKATVTILRKPEETMNKALYIQSFCPTQNEVVAAVEKITGQKFEKETIDSKSFLEEKLKQVADGDKAAVEDVVFVIGTLEADWRKNDGFAMDLLELKDEDLETALREELANSKEI